MDESLIVYFNQLIKVFSKLTRKTFYVDSLVMLSLKDIFLMTLLFKVIKKQFNKLTLLETY